MKFGGNTLANKQKLLLAAQLIKSRWDEGLIPVVVASANGKLTDVLLDHAFSICPTPDKRELDMLITTGERVSVALLSIALRALGVPSVSLTGSQIGLVTTATHNGADILTLKGDRLAKEIEAKHVPIVAGFQGIGEDKEITTLKRGGSDVSAVFLAHKLGADHVEMIKDVDGVYSDDPRTNPKAKKYDKITYDDIIIKGLKVMDTAACALCKQNDIPIIVFDFAKKGAICEILKDKKIGTIVNK